MLGLFIELQPDEHLASGLARLSRLLGYPPHDAFKTLLFGSAGATAIDCPNRIGALASRLPTGSQYSADYLLRHHTPFNYYAAFSNTGTISTLRSAMIGDDITQLRNALGGRWRHSPNPQTFRFCPQCAAEELVCVGYMTWRRSHQLPSVLVCSRHSVFLHMSDVAISGGFQKYKPLLPDVAARGRPVMSGEVPRPLIKIAVETEWILSNTREFVGEAEVARKIWGLLDYYGWVRGRMVALAELREAVRLWCGSEVFTLFGLDPVSVTKSKDAWPSNLYRPMTTTSQPAFRYIILLAFLGCTARRFFEFLSSSALQLEDFDVDEMEKPLGRSPIANAVCANPVCDHYTPNYMWKIEETIRRGENVILRCALCQHTRAWVAGAPLSCKIVEGGPAWEKAIRTGVDEGLSIPQLAKRLQIGSKLIVREARRMGIWGRDWRQVSYERPSPSNLNSRITAALQELREARLENPFLTRSKFKVLYPQPYSLLSKHAPDVLNQVMPSPGRIGRGAPDWAELDLRLTTQAKMIAAIHNSQGNPERSLFRGQILKEISEKVGPSLATIYKNSENLPHLWLYMNKYFPGRNCRKR